MKVNNLLFIYPVSTLRKQISWVLIGLSIFVFITLIEKGVRSEDDLSDFNLSCGVVADYYFDNKQIKGHSTWYLIIESENIKRKKIQVGSKYLQEVIGLDNITQGSDICVYSLSNFRVLDPPFVSQIVLNGKKLLNEKNVQEVYLEAISRTHFLIFLGLIFCLFFCFINIEKEF